MYKEPILSPSRGHAESEGSIPIISSMFSYGSVQKQDQFDEQEETDTLQGRNLGTFLGVYVPACNGIFDVTIFLRWGFAVGQAGLSGALWMILLGTIVGVCAAISMSAIVTNGSSNRGGVYYFISRTLGPEIGASVGIQFFLCSIMGVSFVCLGISSTILDTYEIDIVDGGDTWDNVIIASASLLLALIFGLFGTKFFAEVSMYTFLVNMIAIITGIVSLYFANKKDLDDCKGPGFLGPSYDTLSDNWKSDYDCTDVDHCPSDIGWVPVFAILYASTTGFLSGANMSGDLKNPSKSIPKGIFLSVLTMFLAYILFTFSMAVSIDRVCLRTNYRSFQESCFLPIIVFFGTIFSAFSAALGRTVGAAKILQAIGEDSSSPFLSYFGELSKKGEPIRAITVTYSIAQTIIFFGDINALAPFISNFMLLTFMALNCVCFLLDVTGIPNFRPTFQFYSWPVALFGAVASLTLMFVLNPLMAGLSVLARKYLLLLDTRKEHVKFWRPQVMLFLSGRNKRHENMAVFCNDIKKGGLFVIAHVNVGDTKDNIHTIELDRMRWLSVINSWDIKAFFQYTISPTLSSGILNVLLTTGLGAMRPNTVAFGLPGEFSPDCDDFPSTKVTLRETMASIRTSYSLDKNVLILNNFEEFDREKVKSHIPHRSRPRFDLKKHGPKAGSKIDLWFMDNFFHPITEVQKTVALQLTHIFHRSHFWVRHTRVRVLFVESTRNARQRESLERLLDMTRTFADIVPVNLFEGGRLSEVARSVGVEIDTSRKGTSDSCEGMFVQMSPMQKSKILNRVISENCTKTSVVYIALATNIEYFDFDGQEPCSEEDKKFLESLGQLSFNLPPTAIIFPTDQSVMTTGI